VSRPWHDPIIWSHAPIGAAAGLWMLAGAPAAWLALAISTVLSVLHHRAREQSPKWRELDHFAAVTALLITLGHFMAVATWDSMVQATTLLAAALLAKELGDRYSYAVWHTLWHLLVALGQAFLAAKYGGLA
jgi:hypothetical protein